MTANQTAGRGRLDRSWVAPPGAALAISVLLRTLPDSVAARGWIPLLAGTAMADAVARQLPGHRVGVKWPNDVLVDGEKISGILAETSADAIIVGVGVNTAMAADQLPAPTATSFAILGADVDPDTLVADFVVMLDELVSVLDAAQDAALTGVHRLVSARCLTLGQDVTVSMPDGSTLVGRARRLDDDGRLVVDDGALEHAVAAGDVVHVRPA